MKEETKQKIGNTQHLRLKKNKDEKKERISKLPHPTDYSKINSHLKGRVGENIIKNLFTLLGNGEWLPFEPETKTDIKGVDLVLVRVNKDGYDSKIITLQVKTLFSKDSIQVKTNVNIGRIDRNHLVIVTRFDREKFDIADNIFLCDSKTIADNSKIFKRDKNGKYIINAGLTTNLDENKRSGRKDDYIISKLNLIIEINKKISL